ncbi:MAG: hypothetical protein ACTS3F_08325 [Phycisphaerales bacterium]
MEPPEPSPREPDSQSAGPEPVARVRARRRFAALAALFVVLAYLIPAATLILTNASVLSSGLRTYDEIQFHLPTIEQFSSQLPAPDLSRYAVAMTPGYHLVLAVAHRLISDDIRALRLFGTVFTLGLLALLGWSVGSAGYRTRFRWWEAGILTLPVLCSPYVFPSGVWVVADNAGWVGVVLLLSIVLSRPPIPRYFVLAAIVLAITVLLRQINLWACGLIWLWAWIGPPDRAGTTPPSRVFDGLLAESPDRASLAIRFKRLRGALLATLPAMLIVLAFAWLWGWQLVPPGFQAGANEIEGATAYETAFNPTAIGLSALLFGVASCYLAGYLIPRWCASPTPIRTRLALIAIGAAIGLLAGVLPISEPTDPGQSLVRASGYWTIIDQFPVWGGRSPVFALGAMVGGIAGGAWLVVLPPRQRWLLLGSIAGVAIACSSTQMTWQRYSDPLIMIVAAMCVVAARPPQGLTGAWKHIDRFAWIGPLLFAGIQATLLVTRFDG